MKIGNDFEITADRLNWLLTEWTDGQDKDGNPKRRSHVTYHNTLEQACMAILNRVGAEAADGAVLDVLTAIADAHIAIAAATKGVRRDDC